MGAERPLGEVLDWEGARAPSPSVLSGRYVELRPIEPDRDAPPMFEVSHDPDGDPTIWTYLFEGPFGSLEEYRALLVDLARGTDQIFYAIVPAASGRAEGQASYLRIEPVRGSIEIGNIWFGPLLRQTAAATEAIYLLARETFETLGYRRLEWKCNALNAPSRRAAERLGFTFEGVFRQHLVVKGRNRDTAWFSIVDSEWPAIKAAFEAWLDPSNFDDEGRQRRALGSRLVPDPGK